MLKPEIVAARVARRACSTRSELHECDLVLAQSHDQLFGRDAPEAQRLPGVRRQRSALDRPKSQHAAVEIFRATQILDDPVDAQDALREKGGVARCADDGSCCHADDTAQSNPGSEHRACATPCQNPPTPDRASAAGNGAAPSGSRDARRHAMTKPTPQSAAMNSTTPLQPAVE